MSKRVLLLQSDLAAAKTLADYFEKRGDRVWQTSDVAQARSILQNEHPQLVFLDLHLPGNDWLNFLSYLRQSHPKTAVISTNKHPDLRREMLAKERGVWVFLRQPFTPLWIERSLQRLAAGELAAPAPSFEKDVLPRVRMPMRAKITFPYVVLALLFAAASAFLVSRYVLESIRDRFTSQLIDVGKISADWMVQEEVHVLESLRLLANTQGISEAVLARDSNALRQIALPVAVNYQEEAIEILDPGGISLLSLHHRPGGGAEDYEVSQGDASLAGLEFVQKVLLQRIDSQGNKYAGLAVVPWGDYFYIAGPILDESGRLVGAIAVGESLVTLTQRIRLDTLAHVTIYTKEGIPLASTLFLQERIFPLSPNATQTVLQRQDSQSTMREFSIASANYSEILGPWEARGGEDLGVIGVSLAQNYLSRPTLLTQFQVFLFVVLIFLGVIALGLFLARQITRPLSRVVQASIEVARGNLEVKVPSQGNDEVMVLAHAFNYMVSGLQEGFIYRDLLGRTVSPEVRETLRHSFASGDLRLEGQNATGTVLMTDIRGFTALAEKEQPSAILNWLNEYFGELVPVITAHGGVVDKFEGDAVLAFFGILPSPLPPQESAYQACQAAVELLAVVERLNARRAGRGEPTLTTGIGVNTGTLIAGSVGTSDRLDYTIIGDAVNTTQRIGEISREFGESGVVVSENTLAALAGHRGDFRFEPLGERSFKGKLEMLWVYRMWPAIQRRNEIQGG